MFGALGSISDKKKFTYACRMCQAWKNVRAGFLIFTFRLEKQHAAFVFPVCSNAEAIFKVKVHYTAPQGMYTYNTVQGCHTNLLRL